MDGHVAVRAIHVLAATVLVGVPLGVAIAGRATVGTAFLKRAARYEVAFWLALGVIVATGVGNLGVFGDSLPGPGTDWGTTFLVKMMLLSGLALLSAVRMLIVLWLDDLHATTSPVEVLVRLYGVTFTLAAAIVITAVWMSHG